jgi:hypothetical protein
MVNTLSVDLGYNLWKRVSGKYEIDNSSVGKSGATLVKISFVVFWVVTPCSLVGGYRRFEGTYRVLIQGWN